jgi:hypothetical protein
MARAQMTGSDASLVKNRIEDTTTRKAPEINRPIPTQASAKASKGTSRTAPPRFSSSRLKK